MFDMFNVSKNVRLLIFALKVLCSLIVVVNQQRNDFCHHPGCKQKAPESYPNNMHLCDAHKVSLREKLETYKIPLNQGTSEERQKLKKLNDFYQKVIEALEIPDAPQSFDEDQHKYPKNYFIVSMSKLLYCQQELFKPLPPNCDEELPESIRKMKEIIKQLMDLLITCRQSLNCHWKRTAALIVDLCSMIGCGFAWVVANSAYIAVLYLFLGFCIGVIIAGFIFSGDDEKFVAGAAAVGTGAGMLVRICTAA